MKGLALEAATSSGRRIPSGSWVRDMVGNVPEGEMREKLDRALESTLDQVKSSYRLFNVPIMAAADKHDIPRHDPNVDKGILEEREAQRWHDEVRDVRHAPVRRGGEESADCMRADRSLRRERRRHREPGDDV